MLTKGQNLFLQTFYLFISALYTYLVMVLSAVNIFVLNDRLLFDLLICESSSELNVGKNTKYSIMWNV